MIMANLPLAFCGLGLMGGGMARRLLAAGFPLTVYNRDATKGAVLKPDGAKVAATPREAAAQGKIIFSMVADDNASRSVWFGNNGALQGAAPGTVLVESSTVSVGWIKELAAAAADRGCELLDAPVTGSKTHSAAGELLFLVGGSAAALETARPALAAMGSRGVNHLGPTGSGALLKLINNFLCGVQVASLAEGLALIEASGLDRTQALEILKAGAPGSPMLRLLADRMTGGDYTPHFLMRLMAKDLNYAITEGEQHSLKLTTAASALDLFRQAMALGLGEKDTAAVIELFHQHRGTGQTGNTLTSPPPMPPRP
jgi:3-hydroxyisobutyrate dehydrogenase